MTRRCRDPRTELRFEGRIAGFGTTSGVRIVVGMWRRSPLGTFTDVFVERPDGHRILFAPSAEVAEFVASTYTFDETRIAPVHTTRIDGGLSVEVSPATPDGGLSTEAAAPTPQNDGLSIRLRIGALTPLGRLLRSVPAAFATRPWWLRLIDPVAALVVPGVHTAGSAGNDRDEFYGVTALRAITAVSVRWDGDDLGTLARLHPPVSFGFGSAPPTPQLADVVTTIRPRRSPRRGAGDNRHLHKLSG